MADSPPPLEDVEIEEEAPSKPAPDTSAAEIQEQDEDDNIFADALQSPQESLPDPTMSSDTAPLLEEPPNEPEPAKTEEPSAPPPTLEPTVAVQKESPEISQKAPISEESASEKPVMDLFGEDEEKETPKEKVRVISKLYFIIIFLKHKSGLAPKDKYCFFSSRWWLCECR